MDSYKNREETTQEANKAAESQIKTPDAREGTERGVKILSSKPGEQQGVQQMSKREPGELETTVEVAVTRELGPDGKKQYIKVIEGS